MVRVEQLQDLLDVQRHEETEEKRERGANASATPCAGVC